MTKFKEYLRAKGIKLECDYASMPHYDLVAVKTCVSDKGVVLIRYFRNALPQCTVYYSDGHSVRFGAYKGDIKLLCTHCALNNLYALSSVN